MREIVGRVGKLVGHEVLFGIGRDHFARQTYGAVGPLRGRGKYHLRPVRTQDLAPFDRHRLAHHDLHGIPFDYSRYGEPDTRIARRGFYDGLARTQCAAAFGGLHHPHGYAVLYAARGVEPLQLGIYVHARIGAQSVDPHHRRGAYRLQDILFYHDESRIDYFLKNINKYLTNEIFLKIS